MISIEKVKQSVKSTTIGIIVLNIIQAILGLLGIVGLIFFQMLLTNEEFATSMETNMAEQGVTAQDLATSFSTFALVLSALSILAYVVILVLAIINYMRLKNGKAISMIPYYLGLAFSAYGVLSGLYYFTLSSILIQGAILAFYVYAFLQARKLTEALEARSEGNSPIL